MKKIFVLTFFIFIGLLVFGLSLFDGTRVFAQTQPKLEINFFYSETCPHCIAEQKFLDKIEDKYPEVRINRYLHTNLDTRKILIDLLKKHKAEKYLGLVPLTFIGDEFFLGFDDENGIGKKIDDSIQRQIGGPSSAKATEGKQSKIHLPIIGDVDLTKYSLPAQAVVLGFFDGFNICSLGALILILGLVLVLRSRSKIFIFGGLFILTTAIVYGLLIVLWYQLFYFLAPVLKIMNIFIGILGILGGIYFFKQFLKYRKYGPTCDIDTGKGVVGKFSKRVQENFKQSGGLWAIIISIFIFAVVITVVEFPCSAVIPVFFASALANAQLPALTYLLYIAIYILFYMLDEIAVFLIALFTMNIKVASGKAIIWLSLIEAIVLFGLGIYYLIGF